MTSTTLELLRYRELFWTWVVREIKVRYKQSLLGAAWAILQPLALMTMFTLVFSQLVQVPSDGLPYPIFSYAAVLPWTFFSTSLSFGTTSLINNMNLVTKTYFPREILPLGVIGAGLFDYAIASSIFFGMMAYYRVPLTVRVLWLPVILVLQVALMLGVTLLASGLTVFYRDVRFVVPLGLQLWFYATPVIYPLSLVPDRLQPFYMLNPMAGLITSYRRVLLSGESPVVSHLGVAAAVSLGLLVMAYWVFKRLERSFADVI